MDKVLLALVRSVESLSAILSPHPRAASAGTSTQAFLIWAKRAKMIPHLPHQTLVSVAMTMNSID